MKIFQTKLLKKIFQKHFFFSFLSIGYLLPLILFGEFTLLYIDKFDNEVVYNYVLGEFYKGDFNATNVFLNGEIKIYWLRRLLQPFSLLYIFGPEFAYWSIDISVKIISYFCFYIFAKKITKDNFISSLCACLFASMNYDSLHGFLVACFPYFTYLVLFKTKLNKKHFLIIVLCALNSELVYAPYFSIFLLFFLIIFNRLKTVNLKNFLILSLLFYLFILISNSNILYSLIFDGPFHRMEIIEDLTNLSFKDFLINFFHLHFLFTGASIFQYSLALSLPYAFFTTLFFPFIFFSKKRELYLLFAICLFLNLFSYFVNIANSSDVVIFKFWNPGYYSFYLVFLYSCIALFLVRIFKFLIFFSIILVFISQINTSLIPFAKNFVNYFKVDNYRNYYTFKGYYLKDTYSKIKNIVKEERVMSLWNADPMVAVMNDIKVIDGEHNLYPLSYKKKFYEVIREELKLNPGFKDYYLNWGHRVYAFINDPKNIKINFLEAKKLGASYVISKYEVNNKNLKKIIEIKNKESIYLYKIN